MAKKHLLGRVEYDRIKFLDTVTPVACELNYSSKTKKSKGETTSFIPSLSNLLQDLKEDKTKKLELVQEDLNSSTKIVKVKPSSTETVQQRRLQWNRKSQRIRDAEKNRHHTMEKQLMQLEKQHITLQVRLRQLELEKQVFTSFFTRETKKPVNFKCIDTLCSP